MQLAPHAHNKASQPVYSQTGELLNINLTDDQQYRVPVTLSEISHSVVQATLKYEDQYFNIHPGINPLSLVRGLFSQILNHGPLVGGSTITMQLARLRFGFRTRNIWGKFQQILIALFLEAKFSKDEILNAYLNAAPYGANIQGIEAASLIYFHKRARFLSQAESIALSVIPQSPNRRWREGGEIGFFRAQQIVGKKFQLTTHVPLRLQYSPKRVPNEAQHISDRIRKNNPDGNINSTLDTRIQRISENVLVAVAVKHLTHVRRSSGKFN